MDKLTVSQCITAEWCRGYNAAVEEANKEINKIKKHNERLKRVLKSKIKVYVYKEDPLGVCTCRNTATKCHAKSVKVLCVEQMQNTKQEKIIGGACDD